MSATFNISDARFGRTPPEQVISSAVPIFVNAQNVVSIPRGSRWNFKNSGAIVDLDTDTNFDLLTNQNIVQGTTLANPNSVSNDTTRSLILASRNSDLLGTGDINAILTSNNGDISGGDRNTVIGSTNCEISRSSTGGLTGNTIIGSFDSEITSSDIGALTRCVILGCRVSNVISSNPSSCQQLGILLSEDCQFVNGAATFMNHCAMVANRDCTMTDTLNNTGYVMISGSENINIDGGFTCHFAGSAAVTATSSVDFRPIQSGTLGAGGVTMDCTSGVVRRTVCIGASNASLVGPVNQCVLTGANPSVTGFSNVFAHSATATANSQAIFGTRVDVTGTGNNLTVNTGYVSADRGLIVPFTNNGADFTLAAGLNNIRISAATSTVITVPDVATMSANFPLNTSRTWKFFSRDATATPSYLSCASGFNNVAAFTRYYLPEIGARGIELTFLNAATPFYFITDAEQISTWSTTVADNFGASPPQANASILPTSTDEATHKALNTNVGYVFSTLTTHNTILFELPSRGFDVNALCFADIKYTINIRHTVAIVGTPFIIRMDVVNGQTNTSFPDSYVMISGTNDVSASKTYSFEIWNVRMPAGIHFLRISQDTTYPITSDASIVSARIDVRAKF